VYVVAYDANFWYIVVDGSEAVTHEI